MKKLMVFPLLTAVVLTVFAQPEKYRRMGVIKSSLVIPDPGGASLPKLSERQVLPCLRALDNGFLVGCRDAEGKARVAFLPLRDEWGHVSARAPLYDPASPSNTVQILNPLPLRPGWMPLGKGETYPVVSSDAKGHTILVSFAGFDYEVVVPGGELELLPPPKPETDPVKLREQELVQLLEKSGTELAELRKRLESVRTAADRLTMLNRDLAATELEKNRVKSEILKAESVCKELLAANPAPQQAALVALLEQTRKFVERQADLEAGIKRIGLEIEPLRSVRKQLTALEGEVEKVQALALARNAELAALQKGELGEDIKQNQDTVRNLLDGLAKLNAELVGQVERLDAGVDSLKTLVDKLEAVQQENQRLQTQLKTLTEELEALEKKIQELQKPAAAEPEKKE
ncbi:MAG: hypothetical protein ACUVWX_04950 [Kiritimatiellia bacterium]